MNGSVHDWAARAAERIYSEYERREKYTPHDIQSDQAHLAAIIATHAEPLVTLLHDCKQEHSLMCGCDDNEDSCTCGTSHWNARIEAVLSGA